MYSYEQSGSFKLFKKRKFKVLVDGFQWEIEQKKKKKSSRRCSFVCGLSGWCMFEVSAAAQEGVGALLHPSPSCQQAGGGQQDSYWEARQPSICKSALPGMAHMTVSLESTNCHTVSQNCDGFELFTYSRKTYVPGVQFRGWECRSGREHQKKIYKLVNWSNSIVQIRSQLGCNKK